MLKKLISILVLSTILFMSVVFVSSDSADARVSVKGYYRKDGTYVRPHYRSDPDGITTNNWSYCGNTNPYTGEIGSVGCNGISPNTATPLPQQTERSNSNNTANGNIKMREVKTGIELDVDPEYVTVWESNGWIKISGSKVKMLYLQSGLEYDVDPENVEIWESIGWVRASVDSSSSTTQTLSINPKSSTNENFFTIGSSKEDVIKIMGEPTYKSSSYYSYGNSLVMFDSNSKVSGWAKIGESSLNVSIGNAKQDAKPFTLGSSKQDVIDAMGTPDSANLSSFTYGYSLVFFDYNGKVSGWAKIGDSLLKVFIGNLKPEAPGIEIGSTVQQVVDTMGTPDSANSNYFTYGYSLVFFSNGKVSSYANISGNLKVKK